MVCFIALLTAVRRKENGWYDEDHPLVFLFLGSSGIGMPLTFVRGILGRFFFLKEILVDFV